MQAMSTVTRKPFAYRLWRMGRTRHFKLNPPALIGSSLPWTKTASSTLMTTGLSTAFDFELDLRSDGSLCVCGSRNRESPERAEQEQKPSDSPAGSFPLWASITLLPLVAPPTIETPPAQRTPPKIFLPLINNSCLSKSMRSVSYPHIYVR